MVDYGRCNDSGSIAIFAGFGPVLLWFLLSLFVGDHQGTLGYTTRLFDFGRIFAGLDIGYFL
jgi:hypothetical protein